MRKKTITIVMLCFILSLSFVMNSISGYAVSTADTKELIDVSRACDLTVTYTQDSQVFAGETVDLWRIASVSEEYQYAALPAFSSLGLKLNGIKSQTEWENVLSTVSAFAETNAVPPKASVTTDAQGKAHFDNLQTGLYLVSAVRADNGEYLCVFQPFIVSLPMLEEDHTWNYSFDSHPKCEEYKPKYNDIEYKVVKLWKDAGFVSKRPSGVDIELYRNKTLVETVKLNAANNWSYRWVTKDDGSVWQAIEKAVPAEYTMTVQKSGETFTITNTTTNVPDKPVTGDSSNLLLWSVLAMSSGMLLIIIAVTYKKKAE